MKALSFELSGKTACFKKPDVNAHTYFTYNNIHKVALLGILGSILGFGGHTQQYRYNQENEEVMIYPEFYRKLNNMKIAIKPVSERGYFSKKVQVFNNSVGYANKDGNLIVREQWLENPKWQIYILQDKENKEVFSWLEKNLLTNQYVYMPYLGKNDHPAQIISPSIVDLKEVDEVEEINSLFILQKVKIGDEPVVGNNPWIMKEKMPVGYIAEKNFYIYEEIMMTNLVIEDRQEYSLIYKLNKETLFFF